MSEQPRPRILDLFCGAGGAAWGYHEAGFDVVGVDITPQHNYPFEFWQLDALEVLYWWRHRVDGWIPTRNFDAIHASTPCQGYTRMHGANGPRLIAPVRELLLSTGLPYVIENVAGARSELRDPVMLCGSSFGLGVERHRYFECSFPVLVPQCSHAFQEPRFEVYDHGRTYLSRVAPVYGVGGGKAAGEWAEAMGIDWMTREELAEAIPPAYTRFIGEQLIDQLQRARRGGVAV